ncbi:MAG: hypothetical protein KJ725_20505 [Gammaproteobacteria bacterium]|nr:hypothetical protein [Gammaproteobacteria bacterium]
MLRTRHQATQLNVLSVEQPAQEDHLALGFQHEQRVGHAHHPAVEDFPASI